MGEIATTGNKGKGVRSDCFVTLELTGEGGIHLLIESKVIVMYGDAAKVRWNNGHETWIAGAWLRLDLGRLDETTSGELARRTDSRRRPAN